MSLWCSLLLLSESTQPRCGLGMDGWMHWQGPTAHGLLRVQSGERPLMRHAVRAHGRPPCGRGPAVERLLGDYPKAPPVSHSEGLPQKGRLTSAGTFCWLAKSEKRGFTFGLGLARVFCVQKVPRFAKESRKAQQGFGWTRVSGKEPRPAMVRRQNLALVFVSKGRNSV